MKQINQTTSCPTCQQSLAEPSEICPNCGQSFCPECGAAIAADAAACQSCGAEFGLYCSECEQEIDSEAATCPHCGASLTDLDEQPAVDAEELDLVLSPRFSGECPNCGTPLFLEDGFCGQCGTMLCAACGEEVSEDDEVCPHCRAPLFFDCPLCGFELTAGTDQCPSCNALIPSYCKNCYAPLQAGAETCSQCHTPVKVTRRKSARIIHSLQLGEKIVQVASCLGCGRQLHLSDGHCAACGYRFCPQCQISLEEDERSCPRCGPHQLQFIQSPQRAPTCPNCAAPLQPLDDQCPQCDQLLCPECQAGISEDDLVCPQCGVEFEYACPQCAADINADDETCPQCGFEF